MLVIELEVYLRLGIQMNRIITTQVTAPLFSLPEMNGQWNWNVMQERSSFMKEGWVNNKTRRR